MLKSGSLNCCKQSTEHEISSLVFRLYKLYQFKACPFCVKVRRAIKREGLNIETRDAKNNEQYRQELLEQGGKVKVPCLRIEKNGQVQWLYESNDIIAYLNKVAA